MARTVKFDLNDLRTILEPFLRESGWIRDGEKIEAIDLRARRMRHVCATEQSSLGVAMELPGKMTGVSIRIGKGEFEDADDGPESADFGGKRLGKRKKRKRLSR